MKKLIAGIFFCMSITAMEKKKRKHDDKDITSPAPSALSTPEGPIAPAAFLYYCKINNAISRNYCNESFDDLEKFKRHLKIQHSRLPKDYEKYCSKTPRIKREKK
jgi:hypothetical protein